MSPDLLWRCAAGFDFWTALLALMRDRQTFHDQLWSFALHYHKGWCAMTVAAAGSAPGSALTPAQWAASPLAEYLSFVCGSSSARNSRAASRLNLRDSFFASPLLRWDSWAHTGSFDRAAAGAVLEYSPLLNARAHPMALIRDAKKKPNALQSAPKTAARRQLRPDPTPPPPPRISRFRSKTLSFARSTPRSWPTCAPATAS